MKSARCTLKPFVAVGVIAFDGHRLVAVIRFRRNDLGVPRRKVLGAARRPPPASPRGVRDAAATGFLPIAGGR